MVFNDLLQKGIENLKELLAEKQALSRELRFKARSGQLKTVKMIALTKTEIAQIKTALKQLEKNS